MPPKGGKGLQPDRQDSLAKEWQKRKAWLALARRRPQSGANIYFGCGEPLDRSSACRAKRS
jgi:hypothetical protein